MINCKSNFQVEVLYQTFADYNIWQGNVHVLFILLSFLILFYFRGLVRQNNKC